MRHTQEVEVSSSSIPPILLYALGLAPNKIGGVERFLYFFSRAMIARGWMCVFCFDGEISDEFRSYISHPRVILENLPGQGGLGLSAARDFWHLVRRYRPEAFTYAFNGVMRIFPWLVKLGAGTSNIYFNDHSSRDPEFRAKPLVLHKRFIGRILTAPLKGVISVSNFTRRTGQSLGLSHAPEIVIHNGVECGEYSRMRADSFREYFAIPRDRLIVSTVCWMVEVKGIETALQAAARILSHEAKNVHFVFAGAGDDLEKFKRVTNALGIEDHVTFTGPLKNPVASGVFDATDIYLQPTRWQESSGLAVLEAMCMEAPVVASNIGALSELITEGENGFLVPANDDSAFADRLLQLIRSDEMRHRMGEQARLTVLNHHRIEMCAADYATVITQPSAE